MSPYYQKIRGVVGNGLLIMPAVAAVIRDDSGRLLLQEKHDGSWSLPAGGIEPGESPDVAVAREVKEETGITCSVEKILAVLGGADYRHVYPNGDQVEYLIVLFHCGILECGPILDDAETKEIRYFSRDEMPDLALPYDKDLLFGGCGNR